MTTASHVHQSYVEWLEQQHYGLAVTLNFKPNIATHQAEIHASKFWNIVDRAVFGANAVKRHNQRLNRVCVLEGLLSYHKKHHLHENTVVKKQYSTTADTPAPVITRLPPRSASFNKANPHYHCAVKTVGDITDADLAELITNTWAKMRCAGRFSDFEIIHIPERTKWLNYITKQAVYDSLCLQTSTLKDPDPTTPVRSLMPATKYPTKQTDTIISGRINRP